MQVDKLGNRIAYKRQLQAFFTVHDAVERARAEASGQPLPPGLNERTKAEPAGHIAAALTTTANGGPADSLRALAAAAVHQAAAAYQTLTLTLTLTPTLTLTLTLTLTTNPSSNPN